jgi:hypothetical protein
LNTINLQASNNLNHRDDRIDRDNLFKISNGDINNNHANTNNCNSNPIVNQSSLSLFPKGVANTSTSIVENPNPHNLRVGEKVASNKPESPAYNWRGKITRMHPTNPELCYVNYPERKSLLNINSTEISCRFDDLRRI